MQAQTYSTKILVEFSTCVKKLKGNRNMASGDKEEFKTIKVKASTHSRLAIMSAMLNQSIAELIDELLEKTYPEIVAETDRAMNKVRSLKEKSDGNSK
jgi:hypothetical protein